MSRTSERVDRLLDRRDWRGARRVMDAELMKRPRDHWYLSRLSWMCAVRGRASEALRYSAAALRVAPGCPLALWDRAGALQEARRVKEAEMIYRRLIRRGVERLAHGECGEGLRVARGLIADCHYMLAVGALRRGETFAARRRIAACATIRKHRCSSIFSSVDMQHLATRIGVRFRCRCRGGGRPLAGT